MMRQIGHDSVLNRAKKPSILPRRSRCRKSGRNVMNQDILLACDLARLYGLDLPITEQLGKAAMRIVKANESR
jgi:hypothetical protein